MAELTTHLQRCLDDPAYGYGQRGDNGRTLAQGLVAVAEGDLAEEVAAWLNFCRDFQQAVLAGEPLSLRTLFDTTELDTFRPVLRRLGQATWRLGVEGEGKHRDFEGSFLDIWPRLADAYVQWYEADNARWLENLKRAAARLPDTIQRAAWADRLRKERDRVEIEDNRRVKLITERDGQGWPRFITLGDRVGLARLSGHSFYELSWDGGLRTRRFEISGTTRRRVPFEHIEVAVRLAEALLGEEGPRPVAQRVPGPLDFALSCLLADKGLPVWCVHQDQPRSWPGIESRSPSISFSNDGEADGDYKALDGLGQGGKSGA